MSRSRSRSAARALIASTLVAGAFALPAIAQSPTAGIAAELVAKSHDANAALIASLRVSPEGQEGLSAFLGKRRPTWTTES